MNNKATRRPHPTIKGAFIQEGRGYLIKAEGDSGIGVVSAIVSVFDTVDSYNERVRPGYFKESIEAKLPKGVWMHDWAQPICKTIEARELAPYDPLLPDEIKQFGGLLCVGEFHEEIQDSWQAYLKIKHGYVDEYSFGYKNHKIMKDDDEGVTDLIKGDVFEWSPVLIGANRGTATVSVKSFLSDGPVGLSLEEHSNAACEAVELLAVRWEKSAEGRDPSDESNTPFINRLKESAEKITALVSSLSDARDADEQATTIDFSFEMEKSRHEAQRRAIRSGASS